MNADSKDLTALFFLTWGHCPLPKPNWSSSQRQRSWGRCGQRLFQSWLFWGLPPCPLCRTQGPCRSPPCRVLSRNNMSCHFMSRWLRPRHLRSSYYRPDQWPSFILPARGYITCGSPTEMQQSTCPQSSNASQHIDSDIVKWCSPWGHEGLMKLVTRSIKYQNKKGRKRPSRNPQFFWAATKGAEQQKPQDEIVGYMSQLPKCIMNHVCHLRPDRRHQKTEYGFDNQRSILFRECSGRHPKDKNHPEKYRNPIFEISN